MDDAIRQGLPLPDSLENAPELFIGLNLFYSAFFDLHGCRQLGNALGPIDWITIDRYCERYEIEGEQYEDMHFFLGRMDYAYLERERNKTTKSLQDAKRAGQQKSNMPRARRRK